VVKNPFVKLVSKDLCLLCVFASSRLCVKKFAFVRLFAADHRLRVKKHIGSSQLVNKL
jgi:hypothetical protein